MSSGKIICETIRYKADATAQVQDSDLVCAEWLNYPVRKFTRPWKQSRDVKNMGVDGQVLYAGQEI